MAICGCRCIKCKNQHLENFKFVASDGASLRPSDSVMGKPEVSTKIESEWMQAGGIFTRTEYAHKYRRHEEPPILSSCINHCA
jgi:hypothetical protein